MASTNAPNLAYALPLDLAWQRLANVTAGPKVRWAGCQTEDKFYVVTIIVMKGGSNFVITSDVSPTWPDAINQAIDRYIESEHYGQR